MDIISAILGAALITAAGYGFLCFYDGKSPLGVRKKGNFICSACVVGTEALTFILTLAIGIRSVPQWGLPAVLLHYILIWAMSLLAVIDGKQHRIPNRFLQGMLLLWAAVVGIDIIIQTEEGLALLFRSLAGGIAGGLIFLLCYILSRKQLGAGDVKLAFVMGLYLTGQRIIGAIFYGIILCCVYSLVQLARKKIGLKDGVPLVPFLYMGTLITLLIL